MPLLASSWLLVESFVIPHGFLKWFYLSFYIHPCFLVFCQLFLWLIQLMKLLVFLFYPLRAMFYLTFSFSKRVVVYLFSYIKLDKYDIFYDAMEPDLAENISPADCGTMAVRIPILNFRILQSHNPNICSADCGIFVSCKNSTQMASEFVGNDGVDEEINQSRCVQDSWLHDYLYSDHYTASLMMMYDVTLSSESVTSTPSFRLSHDSSFEHNPLLFTVPSDFDDTLSPNNAVLSLDFDDTSSPSGVIIGRESNLPLTQQYTANDELQHIYESRMKFFNILYHERLQGIKAISNELLSSPPNLFDCIEATDFPIQYKNWSREARKRLMRSLECDLEMICVAQACLFWEALDHQFHIIEPLSYGENLLLLFEDDISGRFQDVQIQVERFLEDEKCEGEGSSRNNNNTSKRLSFQSLLHVPDVTGFVVLEEEYQRRSEGYCIRASELLEAIDKCIKAFWSYIKTEDKKSIWKWKGLIWRSHPTVEHPQDLELFNHVMKSFDKKWVKLRGVEGRSKCWMRRKMKAIQAEDEKRNIMFSMIDLNLVQRLLKTSLISKSHLIWCQQKLENIDFVQDRVVRGPITHFFPSS